MEKNIVLDHKGLKELGIPFSRVHLWKMEKEGRFPRRLQLGVARVGWLRSEIEAWIKQKAAERSEVEGNAA